MKIHSIRHGFATNSSSSHSVIMGTAAWHDDSKEEIAEKYNATGEVEFGWGYEEHSDMDSIINYAILLLIPNTYSSWRNTADQPVEKIFEEYSSYSEELQTILRKLSDEVSEGYIDHQSTVAIPRDAEEQERKFWDFIMSTSSIIIDNDNH